ncbi:DNA primase [Thiohalobacter thiocyanaticus]|uniref:DNA primase n=1 Tax=Thiohalobacter thiocyanaticus TaxID=585455 RepID=A0A426QJ32_9GAMM|nr:DNA primase [Thiohalobacter thiocyanaticus]RRQ21769.1 DNA primase [Thiohalobacter thiocyanaticus]
MAGRIPQQFIDDLMNRVDIVEVIDSRVPLKKAGREYTACCPFHNEKTPSFTVSPNKQFFHCFGCGAHGTAIGFLMDYEHLDFVEAVEELARSVGVEVPREAGRADDGQHRQNALLYELHMEAARYFQRMLREHPRAGAAVEYLKTRGLSGEVARDFGLGYAPPGWDNLLGALGRDPARRQALAAGGLAIQKDNGELYDRFRDRIMFPIHDRRGRIIGFGGRVLGDDTPKYLNSPETPIFHKGHELYGLFEARRQVRELDRLLVVEGYMDVVALAQFGVRNAVATLGTATTGEHLEQLYRVVPEVVFCFDGDRAGLAAAWRALENALPVLREGREARFLFLPEGEDPDSFIRKAGAEVFRERTANAIPFSDFFFEHLSESVDMQSIDGRARLVEKAKPLLERLQPGVFRRMMVQQLERLAALPGGELAALTGGAGGAARSARPIPPSRAGQDGISPVRHLVALLLQHPQLAQRLESPALLRQVRRPGVDLLVELIDFLRVNPHVTTGGILEHWRGSEAGRHLARLATSRLGLDEDRIESEFDAYAELLLQEAQREQAAARLRYLESRRPGEWSEAERQEHTELIQGFKRPPGSRGEG